MSVKYLAESSSLLGKLVSISRKLVTVFHFETI